MQFKRFNYNSLEDVRKDLDALGLEMDFSDNIQILKNGVEVCGRRLPNSLAVHPMEGCDGNPDGSPGEYTVRRHKRFAAGGAGLLWFEAVAVVPGGKANPRQLCINTGNVKSFESIFGSIMNTAKDTYGAHHEPLCIMQLTHSGRFSVPFGKPEPVIAYNNPYLNKRLDLGDDYPVISDGELERLEDAYVEAAKLAHKAGFHGVDVKGCHRYIVSELFSAYDRKGRYGGDLQGRTLFIRNIIDKIKNELGETFIVASRLNIYDGIPYPYGWGVDKSDYRRCDLDEPLKLIDMLYEKGVRLINVTMGTPYYNPHVNRPCDKCEYIPEEHQLVGVTRLIDGAAKVQKRHPDMTIVGTGYSWLRHLAPYAAAGTLENGKAKIIGFGRNSFAYPDFARDIMKKGAMEKSKCCIACGKCTELMRAKSVTGCVVRDAGIYGRLYREKCLKK